MAMPVEGVGSGSSKPSRTVERIKAARGAPKALDYLDPTDDRVSVLEFKEMPKRATPRTVDGPLPDAQPPSLDRGAGFEVDLDIQARELSAEAMGKGNVVRRKG